MSSLTFEAGAGVRSAIRRQMLLLNLEWKEEKGWLSSAFRATGSSESILRLAQVIRAG